MLFMDNINNIKALARCGLSTRMIAKATGFNRETVMKYINDPIKFDGSFDRPRQSVLNNYIPFIEDLLKYECALGNRKHKLTAKRIHTMLVDGSLTPELPALTCSLRTVERAVAGIRKANKQDLANRFLRLNHQGGKAQIDFGEVEMLGLSGETRHFILVMSFPFSNFRLAHVLPAQNFECLAYGLVKMFERIGRVPLVLRCDNMSTAVAKIIRREDLADGQCNHDSIDHHRRLTKNFLKLMAAYGFDAEFCNPASGNEKGSVENAVGWVRRNFFNPLRSFDGNYEALNEELALFCLREAKKHRYRRTANTIKELFNEELAVMHYLPDEPPDVCDWADGTVSKDCRIRFETNDYQVDLPAGTKVKIQRYWNRLVFYTERGEVVGKAPRFYGKHKDNIDRSVERKFLCERPSAFNSSYLRKILPEAAQSYLDRLRAPKRGLVLRALLQRISAGRDIVEEIRCLDLAIERYGDMPVESVVASYRGAHDVAADDIEPMDSLPGNLGRIRLPARDLESVLTELTGGGHA